MMDDGWMMDDVITCTLSYCDASDQDDKRRLIIDY